MVSFTAKPNPSEVRSQQVDNDVHFQSHGEDSHFTKMSNDDLEKLRLRIRLPFCNNDVTPVEDDESDVSSNRGVLTAIT